MREPARKASPRCARCCFLRESVAEASGKALSPCGFWHIGYRCTVSVTSCSRLAVSPSGHSRGATKLAVRSIVVSAMHWMNFMPDRRLIEGPAISAVFAAGAAYRGRRRFLRRLSLLPRHRYRRARASPTARQSPPRLTSDRRPQLPNRDQDDKRRRMWPTCRECRSPRNFVSDYGTQGAPRYATDLSGYTGQESCARIRIASVAILIAITVAPQNERVFVKSREG